MIIQQYTAVVDKPAQQSDSVDWRKRAQRTRS